MDKDDTPHAPARPAAFRVEGPGARTGGEAAGDGTPGTRGTTGTAGPSATVAAARGSNGGGTTGRRELGLDSRVMTSPMLKAMSHPLRRRIVAVLGAQDYARATDLARQLGVPANTLSFHLRVLADAGLVVEAPEHARDRRDRVWKGAGQSYMVGSPAEPIGPGEETPLAAYLSQMALDQQSMLGRLLAWAPDYATGRDKDVKGEISVGTLRLTQEEARAVFSEVNEVLHRARSLHHETADSDAQAGVRIWDYTFMAAREDL